MGDDRAKVLVGYGDSARMQPLVEDLADRHQVLLEAAVVDDRVPLLHDGRVVGEELDEEVAPHPLAPPYRDALAGPRDDGEAGVLDGVLYAIEVVEDRRATDREELGDPVQRHVVAAACKKGCPQPLPLVTKQLVDEGVLHGEQEFRLGEVFWQDDRPLVPEGDGPEVAFPQEGVQRRDVVPDRALGHAQRLGELAKRLRL